MIQEAAIGVRLSAHNLPLAVAQCHVRVLPSHTSQRPRAETP